MRTGHQAVVPVQDSRIPLKSLCMVTVPLVSAGCPFTCGGHAETSGARAARGQTFVNFQGGPETQLRLDPLINAFATSPCLNPDSPLVHATKKFLQARDARCASVSSLKFLGYGADYREMATNPRTPDVFLRDSHRARPGLGRARCSSALYLSLSACLDFTFGLYAWREQPCKSPLRGRIGSMHMGDPFPQLHRPPSFSSAQKLSRVGGFPDLNSSFQLAWFVSVGTRRRQWNQVYLSC
ncbi:hypothetical protein BC834DRAFT_310192 [Gloeopeniophorella convolvens]|nr:hypothetical protein BC834DRAFT_310192 [Gloeopeniophorella convolvens]